MKTYEVTRGTSGQIGVLVKTNNGRNATLLKHCALHSPTGMETGYSGSGPSDLAASILANYFGVNQEHLISVWQKSWGGKEGLAQKVLTLHHAFKEQFISPRKLDPGQSYTISTDEISSWIAECKS
jgi:hypothetical protein